MVHTRAHTHTHPHRRTHRCLLKPELSPRARWRKGHFNMSNTALSGPAGGLELQQLGGSIAEQQLEKYWTSQSASRDQLFPHQTTFLIGILLDHALQGAQTCLRSPHGAPIQFQPFAGVIFVPFHYHRKSLSNSTSLINILLNNGGKWRRVEALEEEDKVKTTYQMEDCWVR